MQAPGAVNEQEQVQERWAPSRSYSSLELRCAMLEMDMRLEKQRCEEYRRILLALLAMNNGGHHHGQQLPASVPDSEREPVMPLPVGGSSSASGSSVVPTTTIPVPRGATVVPDAGQRHSELPNSLPPLGSSSRLSDGSSRRSIGPTRGGRCRGDLAGAVASSTRYRLTDAEPAQNTLNNDDESLATPAVPPVSRRHVVRPGRPVRWKNRVNALSSPSNIREVFLFSLSNSFAAGPEFDPVSVATHDPSHASGNRFGSRAAVDLFLRENNIDPSSQLKPQDAALADATPDVLPAKFLAMFGGNVQHERPHSRVRNILCLDQLAQPYAPSSPGKPGVLFTAPGTSLLEDKFPSFHVFINLSPPRTNGKRKLYRYIGEYCKVPVVHPTVEVEDWQNLPIRCRTAWTWRIFNSTIPDMRVIHARIRIHDAHPDGPPPSQDDINEWLRNHPGRREGISERMILDAFDSGREQISFTLLKCVGYNLEVSMKLQGLMTG